MKGKRTGSRCANRTADRMTSSRESLGSVLKRRMTVWATPSSGGNLDQAILDDIVRRIVAAARPEKIILFGSAARGEMDRHSDVDLLVVKGNVHRRDTAALIFEKLRGVGAAVDVVVVTPEDVKRYGDSHALVIKPALRDGRVVYDAP